MTPAVPIPPHVIASIEGSIYAGFARASGTALGLSQKRSYFGFSHALDDTGLSEHGPQFQNPSHNHRAHCWIH
jgi:hypothetical protein